MARKKKNETVATVQEVQEVQVEEVKKGRVTLDEETVEEVVEPEEVQEETVEETVEEDIAINTIDVFKSINKTFELTKIANEVSTKATSLKKALTKDIQDTEQIDKLRNEIAEKQKMREHYEEKFASIDRIHFVSMAELYLFEFVCVWLVNPIYKIGDDNISFSGMGKVLGQLKKCFDSLGNYSGTELEKETCEVIAEFVNRTIPHEKPNTHLQTLENDILKLPLCKYEKDTVKFTYKEMKLPKNCMADGFKPMHIKIEDVKKVLPDLIADCGKIYKWNNKGINASKEKDLAIIRQVFLACYGEVLEFGKEEKKKKNGKIVF